MIKDINKNRKKISLWITEETYQKLVRLSLKEQNKNISQTVRNMIEAQTNVQSAKEDVDFIRKQIREEMVNILTPQINRLAKLFIRVGMMTVSFCYFTSKIIYYFIPFKEQKNYDELMSDAKKSAAAYLSMRDSTLDHAFNEFNNASNDDESL